MIDQPFSITVLSETKTAGTIVLEPLRQGFGHTMGVALRRVMLGSLQGAAVTKIKIKGVNHQFTTLKGMKEDIVELILNVKQLRVSYNGDKPEVLRIQSTGPGVVTAKDLIAPATVTIANPELVLATIADKKSKLIAELIVESGTGYLTSEEQGKQKLGVIPVDASFSPVSQVSYSIEATRVGRRTDYDKLILNVETNGTIKPSKAVLQAAQVLVDHFQQVISPTAVSNTPMTSAANVGVDADLMKLTVEELGLPTRIANALQKGEYKTVGDFVGATHADIAKIKNIGEKSVTEIIEKVREKGVSIQA